MFPYTLGILKLRFNLNSTLSTYFRCMCLQLYYIVRPKFPVIMVILFLLGGNKNQTNTLDRIVVTYTRIFHGAFTRRRNWHLFFILKILIEFGAIWKGRGVNRSSALNSHPFTTNIDKTTKYIHGTKCQSIFFLYYY